MRERFSTCHDQLADVRFLTVAARFGRIRQLHRDGARAAASKISEHCVNAYISHFMVDT